MSGSPTVLVDLAGFDGLPVARALFGSAIDRIAPFQSLESLVGETIPVSVLRLCENNFRVRLAESDLAAFTAAFQLHQQQRVWLKQFDWLGSLLLPDQMHLLAPLITPKPPHRIAGLQPNCAAPGRINNISVLVWRHAIQAKPAVELHLASKDRSTVEALLPLTIGDLP
ncbi:MAG: hypothetical protein IGS54_15825 [Elainella sp. C42_A2020_010]|nr:hypothetical protein [Elainella sp. C42_A2020_010]